MSKIVWLPMHAIRDVQMYKSIRSFGFESYLIDYSFKQVIRYGRKYKKEEGYKVYNLEQFKKDPPEILIITCYLVYQDALNLIKNMPKKPKLMFYEGNGSPAYNERDVKYLFTTSQITYNKYPNSNRIIYYPYIDFNKLKYTGHSDINEAGTYIMKYKELWPTEFNMVQEIKKEIPEIHFEIFDGKLHTEAMDYMNQTSFTLHLKHAEGFGQAIIESMAKGRPVVFYKEWIKNKTYMNWAIDGESAIFFSTIPELRSKLLEYINNPDLRNYMQDRTAAIVREKLDTNVYEQNLKNLILQRLKDI